MSRVSAGGLENLTDTPLPTDFIIFERASDGTPRKATVNAITSSSQVISVTTGITAFAGGGQTSATALTTEYNLVTTCATNFDSVKLLTAAAGDIQTVKNSGAAILSVFPNTGDSINSMAVNLSIDIPVGGEVTFLAINATVWHTQTTLDLVSPSTQKGNLVIKASDSAGNTQTLITNASQAAARTYTIPDAGASASFGMTEGAQTLNGVQTFGALNLHKATNAITAFAGGGQGSATALTSTINSITTCATAADSVKLPAATAGSVVQVSNLGAAYASVFPASGDLIDSLAANTSISLSVGYSIIFTCSVTGSWKSVIPSPAGAKYTTGTTTTTFAAGQLTGASFVVYNNTQGTPGSIATRTAAQMFTDDPYARVGGTYRLRVINNQGTGTLTITAGSNVTLTGTMTIAINTYRDFIVTYTTAAALVIQQCGIGTDA